jgi:protein-L-isoaspartate(D-aspartate) O-methyltransferase
VRRLIALAAVVSVLLIPACGPEATPPPTGAPAPTPVPPAGEIPAEEPPGKATGTPVEAQPDPYADERWSLIERTIIARGVEDPAVIDAMNAVPRHLFVPDEFRDQAYGDHPLPIYYGQTISQPYIVALMTEVLEPGPDDVVLEVGTGSGYQAAVLAEIVEQVYTIEIVGALAKQAADRLAGLGYDNVEVKHGDGYFGWEEHAPFDAIIVTAAPDHVPPPLRSQLADGGRMVIPVGPVGGYQELWLIERQGDEFVTTSLGGVRFVPLTRDVRGE